ncbi:MAG: hypothetical protein ACAI25_17625, partial [Planctomycetota bacterium]
RLVALGEARNPALLTLACERGDPLLRKFAARAVATANGLGADALEPDALGEIGTPAETVSPGLREEFRETQVRARSLAEKIIERSGTSQAVALLPWLVPLLATRDPALVTRALEAVRRLTRRDGPPFDVDLIARLLKTDEGEAA